MKAKNLILTSLGLLILLLSYLVPFTLLKDSRDLTLYTFWLFLVIASFITSLIYLRGEKDG